jgi:hypothetical protein
MRKKITDTVVQIRKKKHIYYHGIQVKHISLLKKTKRDTGSQHMGAGKFRHPRRSSVPICVDDGFFLSIYVDDVIFRHLHFVLLRYAWLL